MKRAKYVEPSNYFSKEALKVFNSNKEDNKEKEKKNNEQKTKENEELRKVFKGNNNK